MKYVFLNKKIMKYLVSILALSIITGFCISCNRTNTTFSQNKSGSVEKPGMAGEIIILWASEDKEVASQLVLDYPLNARMNGWVEDITVLIWGPSARLLAKDPELQELVRTLKMAGVKIMANKSCTDSYGVTKELESMGIEVKYLGKSLTTFIEKGSTILTF
jgi:hypothetical protein